MRPAHLSVVAAPAGGPVEAPSGPVARRGVGGSLVHLLADAEDAPRVAAVTWAVEATGAFDQYVVDVSGAPGAAVVLRELDARATVQSVERTPGPCVRRDGEVLDHCDAAFAASGHGAVLVYGTSDAAAAGAIAACRRALPVLWVRSDGDAAAHDTNRRLLSAAADLMFLADEAAAPPTGTDRVRIVGDPLIDAVRRYARGAATRAAWERLGVATRSYALAILTAERVDPGLATALGALAGDLPVLILAPACRGDALQPARGAGATLVGAAGFVDRLSLQRGASVIVTDSDRVRREAAALGVRCEHVEPCTTVPALEEIDALRLRLRTPEPCAALLEASGAAHRIASAVVTAYAPVRLGTG